MFQIFCNGEKVLEKFKKEYIVHKKGFFILAPSGAGKTYFVKNQTEKNWIDGDEIWTETNAQPKNDWWNKGLKIINEVEQRCDIITKQAIDNGLWIMGASNYWLMPDAIVLPDWETNKKYIIERENSNYDGGAKSDSFEQLNNHRVYMEKIAKDNKIPVFESIEKATVYLQNLEKK